MLTSRNTGGFAATILSNRFLAIVQTALAQ
jgi:hypothetical protein